jgi:hypothetical protein
MPRLGMSMPTRDLPEGGAAFSRCAEDEVIGAAAAALVSAHLANLRELPSAHIANELLQAAAHAGLHNVAEVLAHLSQAGEIRRVHAAVNAMVDSMTRTIASGAATPAEHGGHSDQTSDEVIGRVRARCLRWIDLTAQGHGAQEYASAAAHVLADLLGIELNSDWSGCGPHCATGHRFDSGCKHRAQLVSADG